MLEYRIVATIDMEREGECYHWDATAPIIGDCRVHMMTYPSYEVAQNACKAIRKLAQSYDKEIQNSEIEYTQTQTNFRVQAREVGRWEDLT